MPSCLRGENASYRRVILKLSGEMLRGSRDFGIDPEALGWFALRIDEARRTGTQLGVVIGGGNIIRGTEAGECGLERRTADSMGMLATVINGLALRSALGKIGVPVRLFSAVNAGMLVEPYTPDRAVAQLEKGRVVILAGGTGSPFFSTDTAAALRAAETGAEAILKATKVDGVYSSDPEKDPRAKKFDSISYVEVIEKRLGVMDLTAVSLCMENSISIIVFSLYVEGNLKKALTGGKVGTVIGNTNNQ